MQKKLKTILCLLLCVLTVASLPVPALGEVIGSATNRAKPAAVYTVIESNSLKAQDQQGAKADLIDPKTSSSIRTTATKSCSHKWKTVNIKSSATYHKLVCEKCGASKKTKCTFSKAVNIKDSSKYHYLKCTCGNKKKVKCTFSKVVNIKSSTTYHNLKCTCGNTKKTKCTWKTADIKNNSTYHNLKCTKCGNVKKEKCTFKAATIKDSDTYHKLKCTKCSNSKKEKCTFKVAVNKKSTVNHNLVCSKCGKTKTEKCTWNVQKVTGSNIGYHNLTCAKCGKTKKENCAYNTTKIPTKAGGLTVPTCTQDATYYVVCKKCEGKKITTEKKLNHANKVLDKTKSLAATCTAAGYDFYFCPDCKKDGSTLAALKVATPALGHAPSTPADTLNNDVICTRCQGVIQPCFNTLVNQINMSADPHIYYSQISKADSSGTIKKDSKGKEMYNIKIDPAVKAAMLLIPDANFSEEEIKNQFVNELGKADTTFTGYKWKSPYLFQYYPIPESNTVSLLTKNDIKSVNAQKVSSVDFMQEIHAIKDADGNETDKIRVPIENTNYATEYNISYYKNLGDSMTGNIYKITVTLKEEKYSNVKNSTAETALQHATGIDIRTYPALFSQDDSEDGFELKMSCQDVTSNCVITYYFLETGSDINKTYTPLASKYVTNFVIDQHIDLRASMAKADLGLSGDGDIEFMSGTIDMTVSNTTTDYYLFSNNPGNE